MSEDSNSSGSMFLRSVLNRLFKEFASCIRLKRVDCLGCLVRAARVVNAGLRVGSLTKLMRALRALPNCRMKVVYGGVPISFELLSSKTN